MYFYPYRRVGANRGQPFSSISDWVEDITVIFLNTVDATSYMPVSKNLAKIKINQC